MPLATTRVPGLVNRFGVPGNGRSENHTVLVGAGAQFSNLFGAGISFDPRLSLTLATGRFISDPFISDSLLDLYVPRPVEREFELSTTLSGLAADLPVRLDLGPALFVDAGPWVSYRITSGIIQTQRILNPDTARFAGGAREATIDAGEKLGTARTRAGALAGFGIRLRLGDRVEIVPRIHARLDAMSLADGLGARSLSGGFSLGLLFDPADDPRPPQRDSSNLFRPEPRLAVSVDLKADDVDDTMRVRMERTEYRIAMSPERTFYCDSGADRPAARYTMLTRDEADAFTIASLVRLSPAEIYYNALNVIGLRMRRDRSATLRIRGACSPGEPAVLARRRAESVRAYLTGVWAVEPARIAVGTEVVRDAHDPDAMRRISLATTSPTLLAPAVVEWAVARWRAPRLGLSKVVEAEAGIARWELTLRQNDRVVAHDSGRGGTIPDALDGAFVMQNGDTVLPPISAELAITDGSGRQRIARDTLVVMRTRERALNARQSFRYYVVADDPISTGLLNDLAMEARSGAVVHVAPCDPVRGGIGRNGSGRDVAQVAARLLASDGLRGKKDVAVSVVAPVDPFGLAVERAGFPERAKLAAVAQFELEQDVVE